MSTLPELCTYDSLECKVSPLLVENLTNCLHSMENNLNALTEQAAEAFPFDFYLEFQRKRRTGDRWLNDAPLKIFKNVTTLEDAGRVYEVPGEYKFSKTTVFEEHLYCPSYLFNVTLRTREASHLKALWDWLQDHKENLDGLYWTEKRGVHELTQEELVQLEA
jgi:hypothetical protein